MKKISQFVLMAVLSLVGTFGNHVNGKNLSQVRYLHTDWEFSMYGSQEWFAAEVPGTVHQDLLTHHKLPDPFYGMNEEKIQWVEKEDWLYRTSFVLSAEEMGSEEVFLVFEGLDTYADVFLNGALLLQADNMFVGYRVPVKSVLKKGENKLVIRFRSPIREVMPQWESNGFDYPADNDHFPQKLSVFTRKAPYSYGWDWGIRMVTCGIWRPVYLEFAHKAIVEDYFVHQASVSVTRAEVNNQIEINNIGGDKQQALVRVTYRYPHEADKSIEKKVELQPGQNIVSLPLSVESPHLWMPNGWGEPALYEFEASVWVDGQLVSQKSHQIGLRQVRVVQEKDKEGMSFYFEVNGIPMFAKGTNLIPSDALLPRVTRARYIRLLEDIQASHMNVVRVWGGGIYEDDTFFEEADKRGILVWQDFMFACTTYPHDPAFLHRVTEEAEYNIKRLRNHASLAMWCGNNEIYEGLRYWGWKDKYTHEVYQQMLEGYDVLFRQLLPEKVKELDPGRFYLEGSPYEANWGRPESWKIADSHNWGIWYGQKSFESLDKEIPRFMSEYGFQAFPEMKTVRTFASPEDYTLESPVMNAHQKSTIGNALIKKTMGLYYPVPEKFEDLVYVGLVLQGQGMRHGMEAHRRHRPYCMGSLPWQLNDSWPVVSWSAIDYYGNWKAMQYQTRRAFALVLVDAIKEGGKLRVYVLSDCLNTEKVTLQLEWTDFQGKVHRRQQIDGDLPVNTSEVFYEEDWQKAFAACDTTASFLRMTLKGHESRKILSDEVYYPVYPKYQHLPKAKISCKKSPKKGGYELTLKSNQLARDVFIEIPVQGVRFSDNFFDLLPGMTKKVTVSSADGSPLEDITIHIHQLSDITSNY